jgi:hypothetical protein
MIATGDVLYNGVVLPQAWPPDYGEVTREPMPLPYLQSPPAVVPIDVGRQLFVDDFLVEHTTLRRGFHSAEYHSATPVLVATKPWERSGERTTASPFSDGVWYDPQDGKIKIWYRGTGPYTCYAESTDGVEWEKPDLDVQPGTNIVVTQPRDSGTVWLDLDAQDPDRRFLAFLTTRREGWSLGARASADGIHWTEPLSLSGTVGDRSTVFYNPFRRLWVWSIRDHMPRKRNYMEHKDPILGNRLASRTRGIGIVPWVGADRLDPHNPNPDFCDIEPQLYNVDAVAYESLMLGLFSVWQGPENDEMRRLGIRKRNDVLLGFSRDGFHWDRPDRARFLTSNPVEGAWNWGNVQSVGGGCLIMGDKLYFYVSGRSLYSGGGARDMTTGLGVLRRDGFASMEAGHRAGTLTTRVLRFSGKHLFVNLDANDGELRVEVLDKDQQPIAPFTQTACLPISVDKTLVEVKWRGVQDISAISGEPVRFRFHLRNGALYSFWVGPERSGASHGYVAAGGPGFTGPRDTVGSAG